MSNPTSPWRPIPLDGPTTAITPLGEGEVLIKRDPRADDLTVILEPSYGDAGQFDVLIEQHGGHRYYGDAGGTAEEVASHYGADGWRRFREHLATPHRPYGFVRVEE